jgi:hypothetical protein
LPAHIHVHISGAGDDRRSADSEVRFDDDPKLTPEWRARSRSDGGIICPVEIDAKANQTVKPAFLLR